MNKEKLKNFFLKAMQNNQQLIIKFLNKMSGDTSYVFIEKDYNEKLEFYLNSYDDNLKYKECQCLQIDNVYLIDIIEKGV